MNVHALLAVLAAVAAGLVVIGLVASPSLQTNEQAANQTTIEAPFTSVETGNDTTSVRAPFVDIETKKD